MKNHDFHTKKAFGQNFLIDSHVLNKIINAANVEKDDCVIEIGPGIGGLTEELARRAGRVIAVEIDKKLIPILKETLSDFDNVTILNADILKTDISQVINDNSGFKSIKVVANLPYYITTPIIMEFLEKGYNIDSLTVMVQKEVAERMRSQPSKKEFGSLSLAVQYFSEPTIVANVPQNCFIPRPNIDSAVIHLKVLKEPVVQVKNVEFMFKVIKFAFAQRRKTLVNCLFNSGMFNMTKEQIIGVLLKAGFDSNTRGETLGLSEFAKISDTLLEE